jgi:hypothetical protein
MQCPRRLHGRRWLDEQQLSTAYLAQRHTLAEWKPHTLEEWKRSAGLNEAHKAVESDTHRAVENEDIAHKLHGQPHSTPLTPVGPPPTHNFGQVIATVSIYSIAESAFKLTLLSHVKQESAFTMESLRLTFLHIKICFILSCVVRRLRFNFEFTNSRVFHWQRRSAKPALHVSLSISKYK